MKAIDIVLGAEILLLSKLSKDYYLFQGYKNNKIKILQATRKILII
jgi:hypothetical protein